VAARAAAVARLLLVDVWTDPTHSEPVFAALMAGELLTAGGEGDVDSEDEARALLDLTGWALLERQPLAGPASRAHVGPFFEWNDTRASASTSGAERGAIRNASTEFRAVLTRLVRSGSIEARRS
jgi:hypothetical protein